MWKNIIGLEREATDENTADAHFTLDTYGYKHTLSEYEIIIAFLQQRWLHERVSILHYT
jgi:hypothetical protein